MALTTQMEWFNRLETARVDRPIRLHQRGRVFFGGTTWPAKFYDADPWACAEVASQVRVVGRQGLTLLVAPPV